MIQSNKSDISNLNQANLPGQQPLKDQILQNLNKSTASSHNYVKNPLSDLNKKSQPSQASLQKIYNLNSVQNSSHFIIQSARKQYQNMKAQDNQFMNEDEINQRILLNGYFSALANQIVRKTTESVARQYSNKIQEIVSTKINQGAVRIARHKQDIKKLLQYFKVSSQELKIIEKRHQIEIKQQKILLLDPFYEQRRQKYTFKKGQANSLQKAILNNFVTSSVLSKEQHKKLVQRFNLSNKQIEQRKKQRLFQIEERERSRSHEKNLTEAQRIKKEKELKKQSIEQKLVQRKKNHQIFMLQQKISTQKYMEMKKKKFLHENMEERYKSQIVIPSLQEKKIKLKEIRDFHKKYDVQEIKKHEQEYLNKKSQSASKQSSRQKITNFHYNPPQRSKRLEELLEDQKYTAKIKLEEKKRIAQQNKIKQINFLSDIKIKYKPKIDQAKKQQIQKRLKSEQAKNGKQERDIKLLGMKHFEQSKKVIKNTKNKQKTQSEVIKQPEYKTERQKIIVKQKTEGNYLVDKEDEQNEFLKVKMRRKSSVSRPQKRINLSLSQKSNNKIDLHEQKRKEIKKIINSKDLDWSCKFERLKMQNQRISQKYKRKEKFFSDYENDEKTREQAVGLLLNSIQAKMGMINLCTKG